MKKLLSVSILAMIAVSPLAAHAGDPVDLAAITVPGAADDTANVTNGVATTNYVKGAYNALQAPVTNIKDAMNVSGLSTITSGQTHYISAGTDVASNLKALDTAAVAHQNKIGSDAIANTGALENYNANLVTAVNRLNSQLGGSDAASKVSDEKNYNYVKYNNTVGENLDVLDDAIGKVALQSDENTIIKNTYQTQGGMTTLTNTVSENLINLDEALRQEITDRTTKIGTVSNAKLSNNASVGANLDTLAGDVADLETATAVTSDDLDSRQGVTQYISTQYDVAANLGSLNSQLITVTRDLAAAGGDSTVGQDGTYVKTAQTVAENLTALDTQVKTNADNIGNRGSLSGSNTGVTDLTAAINNVDKKQLIVYSGWGTGGEPGASSRVSLDLAAADKATTTLP